MNWATRPLDWTTGPLDYFLDYFFTIFGPFFGPTFFGLFFYHFWTIFWTNFFWTILSRGAMYSGRGGMQSIKRREIAPNTGANATKFFTLATKS